MTTLPAPQSMMFVVEVDISPNKGERNLQPVWRSHFDLTALVNIMLRYIVTGQNISRQIFIYTQYWNHNIVLIANIANVFCSQYFPLTLLPNQNQLALNSCCAAAVLRWILRSKEDRIFYYFEIGDRSALICRYEVGFAPLSCRILENFQVTKFSEFVSSGNREKNLVSGAPSMLIAFVDRKRILPR